MKSTLTHLLADAADRDPDGVASTHLGATTTWAGAEASAGRLRAALAEAGVGLGDRVGVHHRKSSDGFVAMHAVVSLGAVAVPLDPSASAGYLRSVVATTGCRAILTHEPCRATVTGLDLEEIDAVIGLDHPGGGLGAGTLGISSAELDELERRPPTDVDPSTPAYLITTSGSTGRPKAITHTHQSATAHIRSMTEAYDLDPSDRMSDIAPLHFDISTLALWVTPAVGATNVVVPEAHQVFTASLSQLAADEAITVWYSVPYLLIQLGSRGALSERDLSTLRWVLFGGEVIAPRVLAELMSRLPGARFSNVYGPAEVNACTVHHLPGPPTTGPIPIGHPIAGASVRLVDADGDEVGPAEQGEIWVSAETMMSGYWQRPDLDACSIVELGDERWYRTGDLGHRSPDGGLVFDGRLDHQVKVRGRRVELEAIEAVLEGLPGIVSAVAAVARTDTGNDEIVAGVTTGDGGHIDPDRLRRQAAEVLPAYAVPERYYPLDSGSTTGSGKLDRRALRSGLLAADDSRET